MKSKATNLHAMCIALLLLTPTVVRAQKVIRFEAIPDGSKVRIDGTSTVHDWHVESPSINGYIEFNGNVDAERFMRVEAADDPAAPMDEQKDRPGLPLLARVVEAQGHRAGDVANDGDFPRGPFERLAGDDHHLPSGFGPDLVALRTIETVEIVDELPDVGPNEAMCHGQVIATATPRSNLETRKWRNGRQKPKDVTTQISLRL